MSGVQERIEILSNRALAVMLMTEVERLDALDDLWTRYLAENPDEADLQNNLPVLEALVGEMIGLLANISAKSRELSALVREYPSDLDAELDQLFAEHPAREQLLSSRPDGPFAQAVMDACDVVDKHCPAEMAALAAKLEKIAAGEFQAGDISRFYKCALFIVGAGAGLMSVVSGAGLIVLPAAWVASSGAVGVVANLITGWNGWRCKKETAPAPPGPAPAPAAG